MIRESRKQRDAASTTLMLIVVIAVFLTTEIPLMVITALHTLSNRLLLLTFYENTITRINSFRLNFMDYYVAKNIVLIINAFICFSYPLNFAIYCGMSRWVNNNNSFPNLVFRQFRDTFFYIFLSSFFFTHNLDTLEVLEESEKSSG